MHGGTMHVGRFLSADIPSSQKYYSPFIRLGANYRALVPAVTLVCGPLTSFSSRAWKFLRLQGSLKTFFLFVKRKTTP